ncbi:hypothetical protein ACQPXH_21260 [Nocardia sp. CA-135953]|uniref:hypothetical protein n=1 Tax=Nocardia sp. CA-135953 TaxID=3239978 RepID=UPI003D97172F
MLILRGSAAVGDQEVGSGGMAYNDARTIYGAEAAGPDGCDFLMIRRAWARNTVVATAEDIAKAEADGIVNSLDRVAGGLSERGLHVFDPESVTRAQDPATGLTMRHLIPADQAADRPPVAVVDVPAAKPVEWKNIEFGLLLFVLNGTVAVDGDEVPAGHMVQVDAGHSFTIRALPADGAQVLSVRPVAAPVHSAAS